MPIPTPPRRLSPDVFTCVDVAKDTQRCMGVRIDWTYTSEYGSLVNHDFSPAIGRALKEIEPWETPADVRAHIARACRGGFGDSARLVAPMTDALADRYERARRALTDEGDS